jgi:ribosomal protein S7
MISNYKGFKLNLYNKLLGFLIKKGNKNKAKKIIDKAFLIVSKQTGYSLIFLLFKLFLKLNVFVEAKTIRIKRRSHVVPFSLSLKRRSYLIIKWLMKAIIENKKKIPIVYKISEEILYIINNSSSKAIKLRNLNNTQALANRSNIHFRW